MKKITIYILLIIIALGSCKKVELPPPTTGDPVFSINAMLDGTALNWTAGDDDFYMFSEFSKDSFDIYTLTGRVAKDDNCENDCEESLSFSIRGNAVTPTPTSFDIDATLAIDSFAYATNNTLSTVIGYRYIFDRDLVDSIVGTGGTVTYFWSALNATSTTDSFIFENMDSNDFRVRLEVQAAFGCLAYFEKTISPTGINDCDLSMDVQGSLGNYELGLSMGNNPMFIWNGATLDTNIVNLNDTFPSIELHELVASSPNCNGDVEVGVCTKTEEIQQQAQLTGLVIPKITHSVEEITTTFFNEQFSTAIIEYRDENGVLYTSQNGENSNVFTISNIKNYDDNEQGEKTKKMSIKYNCTLYNVNNPNDSKTLQGSGIIAVAHP